MCPPFSTDAGGLHRHSVDLRSPGAPEQDVQMDCSRHLSNPRRDTLEHFLLVDLLCLLVLVSRILQRPGRIHLPYVWSHIPALLHDDRTRNSFHGSNCIYCFIVVQHALRICRHIVSQIS